MLFTFAVSVIFIIVSEAGKHTKCYIRMSYASDLFCRETPDRQEEQSTRLKYQDSQTQVTTK